ncbi:hypothetical protein RUND412_009018 [Rhizina undulata]
MVEGTKVSENVSKGKPIQAKEKNVATSPMPVLRSISPSRVSSRQQTPQGTPRPSEEIAEDEIDNTVHGRTERPQRKRIAPKRYGDITKAELLELSQKRHQLKKLTAAKRELQAKQQRLVKRATHDLNQQHQAATESGMEVDKLSTRGRRNVKEMGRK